MLTSYLIACPTYDDAKADLVKGFLSYVVSDEGQQAARRQRRLGSAPGVLRREGRRRSSTSISVEVSWSDTHREHHRGEDQVTQAPLG